MVNILLADDHVIIRNALQVIIENYISNSVIEHAYDGCSAFEKIKSNTYQLIILDVNIPGTDAVGLVSDILALYPEAKILMFSMNTERMYARKFLKLGAMGYLSKSSQASEIIKAIDNILNNKLYITSSLLQSLTKDMLDDRNNNPFRQLSRRELEIAKLFLAGDSLTNICNKLQLHTSTVATYKARIMGKLNCKNIPEVDSLATLYNVTF